MNCGVLLSNAWKMIWNHKELLLIGLIASLISAGRNFDTDLFIDDLANLHILSTPWRLFFILILLLKIEAFVFSVFGKIALVNRVWQDDEDTKEAPCNKSPESSRWYFWRILILEVMYYIPSIIIIIVYVLIKYGVNDFVIGDSLFENNEAFFFVLCFIQWFITILLIIAEIAVIGEGVKLFAGIRRAIDLLRKETGPVIGMSLILSFGTLLVSIPVMMIDVYFLPDSLLDINSISTFILPGVYLLLYWISWTLIVTYTRVASTLTYRRLTSKSTSLEMLSKSTA